MDQIAIPAREYALVFATAALVTYLSTGLVRLVASKIGAVTPIRDRDVHQVATPRMGGVAVYLGVGAAILLAHNMPALSRAFGSSSSIQGVLAAGGVIVLVGVLDDRFDLDAVTKLFGQILAAGVLVLYGVTWLVVWVPSGGGSSVTLNQTQGALVTVLITVVLANAMNFIDGLDGLLAGVAMISAVGIFVFSVHQLAVTGLDASASQAPLISAALIGACLGFLPHNFYPARIFMGDSGSMFIGLTMAASIVTASGQLSLPGGDFGPRSTVALLAPLIVVLAVVFIPLLDFLLAVIRRTKEGRHPFSADKRHLHHRMLAIGHTHRQAVLIFYVWAFVLSAGSVGLIFASWQEVVGPTAVALLVALVISLWPWVRARRLGRVRALSAEPEPPAAVLEAAVPMAAAQKVVVTKNAAAAVPKPAIPKAAVSKPAVSKAAVTKPAVPRASVVIEPPTVGEDRHRDRGKSAMTKGKPAGPDLAANVAAAERAANRSRTGGVWSLGHLPICWAALGVLGLLLVIAGAVIGGGGAAAGAVLGTVIVGLFFSFSAVVIARVGQRNPRMVMVAALSAYVCKIIALGVVLTLMPRDGFVDTHWMAAAVGLGLFGWLGAHMRYVWTTKIYYVDPG